MSARTPARYRRDDLPPSVTLFEGRPPRGPQTAPPPLPV